MGLLLLWIGGAALVGAKQGIFRSPMTLRFNEEAVYLERASPTRFTSWLAIPTLLGFLATPYWLFHSFLISFLCSMGGSALVLLFLNPAISLLIQHTIGREGFLEVGWAAEVLGFGASLTAAIMAWNAP